MLKKRFLLGMLALVFGFAVVGCETPAGEPGNISGYTFEFRVENHLWGVSNVNITQVEIFNGPNTNSQVLAAETFDISPGQMSNVYRVVGFTDRDGSDKRIYGVRVTCENGATSFGYSSSTNGSKIHVTASAWWSGVTFHSGTW